jgi:hypothetical protein
MACVCCFFCRGDASSVPQGAIPSQRLLSLWMPFRLDQGVQRRLLPLSLWLSYRRMPIARLQLGYGGVWRGVQREVEASRNGGAPANGDAHVMGELPDVVFETSLLRWRKRASWGTQFRILSGRVLITLIGIRRFWLLIILRLLGLLVVFLPFL